MRIAIRTDASLVAKLQDLKRVLKTPGVSDTVMALITRAHTEWC